MRGVRTPSSGNQRRAGSRKRDRAKRGKLSCRKNEQIGTSAFQQSPRKLEIAVPVPTSSSNEWVWSHWSKYRKIKQAWLNRLYDATVQYGGIGKFGQPIQCASLTIERISIRSLDRDNLVGGVKPVIDCLITLGFLENDTPDVIQQMDVFQTKTGTIAGQSTRITLIEVQESR